MCNWHMVSSGEGLIGSWVALIMYALSTITKAGILLPLMNKINKPTNVNASMSKRQAYQVGY